MIGASRSLTSGTATTWQFSSSKARGCPDADGSDQPAIGGQIVGADKKLARVVAGDPEAIVAGGWRRNQGPEPLPVTFVGIRGRLKIAGEQFVECGAARECGVIGQVGHRIPANVEPNLAQDAVGLSPPRRGG